MYGIFKRDTAYSNVALGNASLNHIRARTLCTDGLYRFWLQISSAHDENVTQLYNYEDVAVELSYIVFYWPIHAIIGNSTWLVLTLLARRALSPITWQEKSITYWHRCCVLFMIVDLTHQLFRFIYISLWTGFFSSDVFSVWDTGRCNTILRALLWGNDHIR